jgi:hypothetical protein
MTADACLGCVRLEDPAAATVTLLSGQVVCSWCPGWRDETAAREIEARAILRMIDRDTRLARLAALEARHGAEYRRRLEAVVLDLWERRRAARPAQEATA